MNKLEDYDFAFSDDRIALRPLKPRGDAKLLYFDGSISDHFVRDYPELLRQDDLLVFNDTKVLPARLDGVRIRGTAQGRMSAKIAVTLLEPKGEAGVWSAMIKPLKKVELGENIVFSDDFRANLIAKEDGLAHLRFDEGFDELLQSHGRMPLPPYIEGKRPADRDDIIDYQSLMAKYEGAVAAPTASLHFDENFFAELNARGIEHETITLHVGAGTFLPVKVDDINNHKMHAERGAISEAAAERINAHKASGGRVIAVGTTALRLLETAGRTGVLKPYQDATDIFIKPGFKFQIADALITNFHLPKSTLLMLVAAFVGYENMQTIYKHALEHEYRFFSYGDSSFLIRQD